MKNNSCKRAFTLIELLVVVLIIGILAAIALPQYQKAVAKARGAELISMVKAVNTAQEAYFLATGRGGNNFDLLDVSFDSLTRLSEEEARSYDMEDGYAKNNNELGLFINEFLVMGALGTGPYAMSGFAMYSQPEVFDAGHDTAGLKGNELYCWELESAPTGFCEKLYHGTYVRTRGPVKYYSVN